jgi:hypothetical protein
MIARLGVDVTCRLSDGISSEEQRVLDS